MKKATFFRGHTIAKDKDVGIPKKTIKRMSTLGITRKTAPIVLSAKIFAIPIQAAEL